MSVAGFASAPSDARPISEVVNSIIDEALETYMITDETTSSELVAIVDDASAQIAIEGLRNVTDFPLSTFISQVHRNDLG